MKTIGENGWARAIKMFFLKKPQDQGGRLAIVNLFLKSHLQTKPPSSAYWQKQYDNDFDGPEQHFNHFDDHHHQNAHPYHYDDDHHYDDNQS